MNTKLALLSLAAALLMSGAKRPDTLLVQVKSPTPITVVDLDAAIAKITDGQKLGYDLRGYVNSVGKLVRRDGEEVVSCAGLSCSPFASAVLHFVQNGSFKGISYTVHQGFGGQPIAEFYKLQQTKSEAVSEFFKSMKKPEERRTLAGVYLFELNGQELLKDGKTKDHAHVGFLAISEEKVRQVHFSGKKKYQGLANDDQFEEFVEGSLYKDADAKKPTTLTLWRVTKRTK